MYIGAVPYLIQNLRRVVSDEVHYDQIGALESVDEVQEEEGLSGK